MSQVGYGAGDYTIMCVGGSTFIAISRVDNNTDPTSTDSWLVLSLEEFISQSIEHITLSLPPASNDPSVVIPSGSSASYINSVLSDPEFPLIEFECGAYLVDQTILIPSNVHLKGCGKDTVFTAADGFNTLMFSNVSGVTGAEVNIEISDMTLEGNKPNQTPLSQMDGFKFYDVDGLYMHDICINDTEGHSIHSKEGTDQVFERLEIDGAGSSNVGTYGSCLAITDGNGTKILNCKLSNSAKAGIRCSGSGFLIEDTELSGNGNGGLVPVSSDWTDSVVRNCKMLDSGPHKNNDGIRLVASERILIENTEASRNVGAGIHCLNGCDDITILNSTTNNNGASTTQSSVDASIEADDGICIQNNAGTGNRNTNIYVDNTTMMGNSGFDLLINNESDSVTALTGNAAGTVSVAVTCTNIN